MFEISKNEIQVMQYEVGMRRKNMRKRVVSLHFCFICVAMILSGCSITKKGRYLEAQELYLLKNYKEAYEQFVELGDYENASQFAKESAYFWAQDKMKNNAFDEAIEILSELGEYQNSKELILECEYSKVLDWISQEEFDEARKYIEKLKSKVDVTELTKQCDYAEGIFLYENGKYSAACDKLLQLSNYLDVNNYLLELAKKLVAQKNYSKAQKLCEELGDSHEVIRLKNTIAEALKYANFTTKAKGGGELSAFLSATKIEKFLEENVYGVWKDYYTGEEIEFSKTERDGRAYGIYAACEDCGWVLMYYFYQDEPEKIYVDAWHEISVPGGNSQPFIEAYQMEGYETGDYVYAKLTESEMEAYAAEVQK